MLHAMCVVMPLARMIACSMYVCLYLVLRSERSSAPTPDEQMPFLCYLRLKRRTSHMVSHQPRKKTSTYLHHVYVVLCHRSYPIGMCVPFTDTKVVN